MRRHGDPSGLAVAERAHERGKVREAEVLPRYSLYVSLTLEGGGHAATEEIATLLAGRPDVLSIGYTLTELGQ